MATIDDKSIIDAIIAANGDQYPGEEPPVRSITEYTNAWGNVTWGVVWEGEHPSQLERYMVETVWVRNPRRIWERQE